MKSVLFIIPLLLLVPRPTFAELPVCNESKMGNETCEVKTCPKSGVFNYNECKCTCCNGEMPFCDEYCINEICYKACNCRAPGLERWCVSTQWLHTRALQSGILSSAGGIAEVLCPTHLQGLPCATRGHLVRVDGALMPYAALCRRDGARCVSSVMHVSRLRHSYDWSVVSDLDSAYNNTLVQLTSLSTHERDTIHLIARVTDLFIDTGFGAFCDVVQRTLIWYESISFTTFMKNSCSMIKKFVVQ